MAKLTEMAVKSLCRRVTEAKRRRATHDDFWQEVAELVVPSRATFTTEYSEGQMRRRRIYDTTAEEANELLAAGLHGMLTSRSQRWFYLKASDPALHNSKPVQLWLEDTLRVMYGVLNDPRSQFHSQIDQCYLDLGAFGTGVVFMPEDRDVGMMFNSIFLGDTILMENHKGVVDGVAREFKWTLEKVIQRFGEDALPDQIKVKLAANRDKMLDDKHTVLHVVLPREDRDYGNLNAANMPFASCWILKDEQHCLDESGYREFPYATPRWRVRTGETYGTGPGVRLLPEIRMLNEMLKTVMKAAQKVVDPPLNVPDDIYQGPIRTMPGGLNYYTPGTSDRVEPIITNGRVDIGLDMLMQQRALVARGFHNDAFDITSDSDGVNVKATFTMQRRDDKFRKMAPIFSRLDQELFEPIIVRLFSALKRQGKLPDEPPELEQAQLEVEYVSPVARAMRTAEADDILRLFEVAAPMGEVDPEVWDVIDASEVVRLAGRELFNVPPSIMRDAREVAQRRQARQQQQQMEQAIAMGGGAAGALRDAAAAQKDFNAQ